MAIGAQIAASSRTVVLLCGDGGLLVRLGSSEILIPEGLFRIAGSFI